MHLLIWNFWHVKLNCGISFNQTYYVFQGLFITLWNNKTKSGNQFNSMILSYINYFIKKEVILYTNVQLNLLSGDLVL